MFAIRAMPSLQHGRPATASDGYHRWMSGRRVDVSGGRLHVVDKGAGPPIVLLHAGVADQRSWKAVVPGLVAAGYRIVTYDARGVGQSTTDDVGLPHRADLVALLDALEIERAVLDSAEPFDADWE